MKSLLILFACGAAVFSLLLFWGGIRWLESSRGAQVISHWVTLQAEKQVPGTVVTMDQVHWSWPLSFRIRLVRWGKPGQPPILRLDWMKLSAAPSQWLKGNFTWDQELEVSRLDLAALDQALGQGKWKSVGYLAGKTRLKGSGSVVEQMDLQLQTLSGGTLSSEVLQQLLSLMPQGDARGKLLMAIQAKPTFHFNVGKIQVTTEGPVYRFNLLLDGDHLLDVTILVPKESIAVLNQLLNLQ